MPDDLTVADLVAMPNLGLRLEAGGGGAENAVLWTHTSELVDPGPWLEGGELLIVNGFGIPSDAEGQVEYIARLSHHRLAGVVVSVKAPPLLPEMLAEADRRDFPLLRIPKQVPFIELSYLVANAGERSARGRLSRHLRIFETLRMRNSGRGNVAEIYAQLEQVSGYRLSLLSPAGGPLLPGWPRVPDGIDLARTQISNDLFVLPDGFVLPLRVGDRVTAFLVGQEDPSMVPGGLAGLQHVSSIAALDAIDDQRRREAVHRNGGALLASALESGGEVDELVVRFRDFDLDPAAGLCTIAVRDGGTSTTELEIRDWFADRRLPHVLLRQAALVAVVACDDEALRRLSGDLDLAIGVSPRATQLDELARLRRQALWALQLASGSSGDRIIFAAQQSGLARWLNPDVETLQLLAERALHPLVEHDAANGTELVRTLRTYFANEGRLRATASELFVHEHTLTYRLKRIEILTGRDLRRTRERFELWLAVEAGSMLD